mmetsp:Transcript_27315/g.45552  ORF Transcript_27315/g.45552 Transcript_27315/m.45552 type:complete len:223 (-) Transcript_27315:392-1060(-)
MVLEGIPLTQPPSPKSFMAESHSWIIVEDGRPCDPTYSGAPVTSSMLTCMGNLDVHVGGSDAPVPVVDTREPMAQSEELADGFASASVDNTSLSVLAVSELICSAAPTPSLCEEDGSAKSDDAESSTCDPPMMLEGEPLGDIPIKHAVEELLKEPPKRSFWGRPLATIAVLIASHAVALVIGMVIGRHTHTSPVPAANEGGEMLARRFSSGATGYHARLCLA